MRATPTHRRTIASLVACLALPMPLAAQATWDDLPNAFAANTPNPYAGHRFFYGTGSFGTGNPLQYSSLAECRSGPNCAYNASANTAIRIEALTTAASDAFTFSGYLRGGYPGFGAGPGFVLAEGFVGTSASPVFSMLLAVSDAGWSAANFTTVGINRLLLSPVDQNGTARTGYILLDDVTFGVPGGGAPTPAPEPATLALLGAGCSVVAAVRRRARRA